jgi:hypothetical protein
MNDQPPEQSEPVRRLEAALNSSALRLPVGWLSGRC